MLAIDEDVNARSSGKRPSVFEQVSEHEVADGEEGGIEGRQ